MQRKTINKMLSRKFNDWLKSIDDSKLKKDIEKNTIITGGCITSMFLNQKINDFDIYFTNEKTLLNVTDYYVNKFNKINGTNVSVENKENKVSIYIKSSGVSKGKKDGAYSPVFLTGNAITLSNKIQIITRFYGTAKDIHENFDFIHCTNYWTSNNNQLYTNINALESILSKTLFYSGSKYPICSVIRARKFIKRGWKINAGQYLKMCLQISKLDLTDIKILEDQLIGVDSLYFSILINSLKEKIKKEPNFKFKIDDSYIVELINDIF